MPKKRRRKSAFVDKVVYLIFMAAGTFVRCLDHSHAAMVSRFAAHVAYHVLKVRRDLAERNIALAFPEKSREEVDRIVKQVYCNLAENVVEVLRLPLVRTAEDAASLVDIDTRYFRSVSSGRTAGAVLVSAHFGNWELLGVAFGYLVGPMTVVAKRLKNAEIDREINRLRAISGNTVVYKRQALREGLRRLRQGGIMSILADQSDPKGGFFTGFLGRKSSVFLGPAFLALKTGVPLFVCICRRTGKGRYAMEFEEIDHSDLGPTRSDAEELARRYTRVLERYIRCYPEEWFWLHNRWKRGGG